MTFRALAVLVAAAAVFVLLSGATLPEHVASHFGGDGAANGFMPRAGYLGVMLGITVGVPLLLALPGWLIRRLPASLIRLPHKEYWLAPERRASTLAFMTHHSMIFGTFALVFLCYVHWLVVAANKLVPPHLATAPLVAGLVLFVLSAVVWAGAFIAHFYRRV